MLDHPQVECPLVHRFTPGIYLREITMPAGTIVVGHKHLTEHLNIILTGRALVAWDGNVELLEAPHTFVSGPGVRKMLLILEDMVWQTIHNINDNIDVDDLTDKRLGALVDFLEPDIIVKSDAWMEHDRQALIADRDRLLAMEKLS